MSEPDNNTPELTDADAPNTRNLWLFFGGMMLLGVMLSLLLFGGEFLSPTAVSQTNTTAVDNGQNIVFELEEMPPQARIGNVEVGQQAPDFVLQNVSDETIALSDYEGQPVILNFWATWCAPCRIEMPEFEATYQAYQSQGLEILALNREENPTTIGAFWSQMANQGTPLTFVPLLDESGDVANRYGVFNMPTTYFIDRTGQITAVHRGPLTQEMLNGYLAAILPSS